MGGDEIGAAEGDEIGAAEGVDVATVGDSDRKSSNDTEPSAGNTKRVTFTSPNRPSFSAMTISPDLIPKYPSPDSQHSPLPSQSYTYRAYSPGERRQVSTT